MTVKQVVGAGQIKAILASGDTKPSTTYTNGAPVLPGDAIWVYDTDTVYITRDTGTNWVAHGSWTSISAIKTETDQIGTIANTGGTATLGAVLGDFANVTLATLLSRYRNGSTMVFEKHITSAANAGDVTIATATTQSVLIRGIVLRSNGATTANLTTAAITMGTAKVVTLISAATATQAALNATDKQVDGTAASVGRWTLPATHTIVMTLAGTGGAAVDLTVNVEYEPCTDGGYLA